MKVNCDNFFSYKYYHESCNKCEEKQLLISYMTTVNIWYVNQVIAVLSKRLQQVVVIVLRHWEHYNAIMDLSHHEYFLLTMLCSSNFPSTARGLYIEHNNLNFNFSQVVQRKTYFKSNGYTFFYLNSQRLRIWNGAKSSSSSVDASSTPKLLSLNDLVAKSYNTRTYYPYYILHIVLNHKIIKPNLKTFEFS
jgi:hypothetical protein